MYNFKESENRDTVEINGEIVEADIKVDKRKHILCNLADLNRYIDGELSEDIVYRMDEEVNDFPSNVSMICLTKEEGKPYVQVWMDFYYETWELKWSIVLYINKFKEIILRKVENASIDLDVEADSDNDYYSVVLEIWLDDINNIKEDILQVLTLVIESFSETDDELFYENIKPNTYIYKINIESKFTTALKQYLIYFPEYVNKAKGISINFEVVSESDGLAIQIAKDVDFQLVEEYLKEYVGFIKQNIDNIQPKIDNHLTEFDNKLFIMELKNQIQYLNTTLQIKNLEIDRLGEIVNDFKNLLSDSIKASGNNQIALTVQTQAISNSSSNIELKFNLHEELQNIQRELFELKGLIVNSDENLANEVKEVDNEILKLDSNNPEEIKKNKHVFRRLGRLLERLCNINNEINKGINLTEDVVSKTKKLINIYNKFANWLQLIQITEIIHRL